MAKDTYSEGKSNKCSCERFTNAIVGFFESIFFKLGRGIGLHPYWTIILSILGAGLCIVGIIEFQQESRGEKLWSPPGSEVLKDMDWVTLNFPSTLRTNRVLFENDNVLTPQSLNTIFDLHNNVVDIYSGHPSRNWSAICFRQGTRCRVGGILELWNFNETVIRALTEPEILAKVNEANLTSAVSNFPISIDKIIGGISKQNGQINSAKATVSIYYLKNQEVYEQSSGRKKDEHGEEWEKKFDEVVTKDLPGFTITFFSATTFSKDSGDAISGDISLLSIGYILIIIYLSFMLGKINRLHLKVWLALLGVLCVGLAIGVSFGLCSAFQLFYGPVHSVLPFLILGIGVDDVFVIVQSYENVIMRKENSELDVPMKIALTMKHAGMAISVTSITDTTAFLIGATTILPALRSFCLYAGVGIFAMFVFSCTTFVGFLALDAYRLGRRKNACCCCLTVSEDYEPWECSTKDNLQLFMEKVYSKCLLKLPVKILVFLITAGLFGIGFWGLMELKQDFDYDWFLPDSSKSAKYSAANKKYFPDEGILTAAYLGKIDYFLENENLMTMYNSISNHPSTVPAATKSWHMQYLNWLSNTKAGDSSLDANNYPTSKQVYNNYLLEFLSAEGVAYKKDVQMFNDSGNLVITATRMTSQHLDFDGSKKEIEAMDGLMDTVKGVPFNGTNAFVYSFVYVPWNTNKVISTELLRNILLATLCVFLTTLVLLANFWAALMVLSCVAFTLVNVAGYMHFWGLTIDTVTTVVLLLSVGLCVDYAVHIAHAFLTARGNNRNDRVAKALTEIGPAVLNGGVSTFLAFCALGASGSYVFKVFFKVFLLIVVFGLFHGLVYLPCLLSVVGPAAYSTPSSISPSGEKGHENHGAEMENGVSVSGNFKPQNGHVNNDFHYSADDIANMKTALP